MAEISIKGPGEAQGLFFFFEKPMVLFTKRRKYLVLFVLLIQVILLLVIHRDVALVIPQQAASSIVLTRDNNSNNNKIRIGILSTYPPKKCGIAEFTFDLVKGFYQTGNLNASMQIAAVDSAGVQATPSYSSVVTYVLQKSSTSDYFAAAQAISERFDIILIQHEFGIFGGPYGEFLLALLDLLQIPVHVHLHTVPNDSTSIHYHIVFWSMLKRLHSISVFLPELCKESVIVNANVSCVHIPHGVPDDQLTLRKQHQSGRWRLLTPGLISPAKGIEYMIAAMPSLVSQHPAIEYVVMGQQHPSASGQRYLFMLQELVKRLDLQEHVRFISQYQTKENLVRSMADADVIITPYLDPGQVSSGTMSMALGLGCAVISTEYRYAKYMCRAEDHDSPPCLLVSFANSSALALTIHELLTNPLRMLAIKSAALTRTRPMRWNAVAAAHVQAAISARRTPPPSVRMSTHWNPYVSLQRSELIAIPHPLSAVYQMVPPKLLQTFGGLTHAVLRLSLSLLSDSDSDSDNDSDNDNDNSTNTASKSKQITEAISAMTFPRSTMLLYRWLPYGNIEYHLDTKGNFWATNGLVSLWGELQVGVVSQTYTNPPHQLPFGQGALHSGNFLRLTYGKTAHMFRLEGDNVLDWGSTHNTNASIDMVSFWYVVEIAIDGKHLGDVTMVYHMEGGSMIVKKELMVDIPSSAKYGMHSVELVTGIDYLSLAFADLELTKLFIYPSMSTFASVKSDTLLYSYEKDQRQGPPRWVMLASDTNFSLVSIFPTASATTQPQQLNLYVTTQGKFHYFCATYQLVANRGAIHVGIFEYKLVMGQVNIPEAKSIYDKLFSDIEHTINTLRGFDLSFLTKREEK